MFEFGFIFILSVFAINNITNILTTVDLLESSRIKFQTKFPKIGKLAVCCYCQSFWLSMIVSGLMTVLAWPCPSIPFYIGWVLTWFCMHRIIELVDQFYQRYLNQAPVTVFATVRHVNDESLN